MALDADGESTASGISWSQSQTAICLAETKASIH